MSDQTFEEHAMNAMQSECWCLCIKGFHCTTQFMPLDIAGLCHWRHKQLCTYAVQIEHVPIIWHSETRVQMMESLSLKCHTIVPEPEIPRWMQYTRSHHNTACSRHILVGWHTYRRRHISWWHLASSPTVDLAYVAADKATKNVNFGEGCS